jgi:UDP-N-acetylmuramyl pentapeptide phosphotransferase/UDP-N-acetylglucosamine-1-phosphate transferase
MLGGTGITAFVVAFIALRVLLSRFGRFALDAPNARSLHQHAVPRTGGIAVLLGVASSAGFGALELWMPMAVAAALAVLSLIDDMRGLPGGLRLAAHLAGAGVVVWYLLAPMNAVALVVLALAVAWITNLYNFMDGADGVAGGMALIGFGAYALAAALAGRLPLAALCVALAAAAAAFLLFNFHPARIFLGDVGSIPIGFFAGALGLAGWRDDAWPLWFPLLVFGPFIADATVTLLKRLARREPVWRAHRDHYYQRMVRMGLGHRGTALAGYGAMLVCAGAALAGRNEAPALQAAAFAAASAVLGAAALWVEWRWAQHRRSGEGMA